MKVETMEKLILTVLALGLVCQFTYAALAGSAKFAPRSFSVVTKMTREAELVSEAVESYSFEQKRAIIDYRLFMADTKDELGLDSTAHYFHEQERDIAIAYGSYGKDCKQVGRKSIFKTLTLQPDLAFDLFPLGDEFEFVTGPARVMLYVINKLFDINDKPSKIQADRNVPTVSYRYRINDSISLYATYAKASIDLQKEQLSADPEKNLDFIMPIEIYTFHPNESSGQDGKSAQKTFFSITYKTFESLDTKSSGGIKNLGGDLEFDRFVLNLYSTCREFLKEKREVLFHDKNTQFSRFSFKSTMDAINYHDEQVKRSAFVAYDGNLDTMLMERWDPRKEVDGYYEKMIYNFKVNRFYHAVKGRNVVDSRNDYSTCIISRIFAYYNQTQLSVADILFGTDKFIYLGLAQVRGIWARVYHSAEEYINTPFWIDGGSAFADKSTANSNDSTTNSPRGLAKLKVILYLAAHDGNPAYKGDKILRTTVSNYNYGSGATSLSHLAALYDFNWNLDFESPKGNKLIDFFSLEDDCPGNVKAVNRAKIDLLLYPEQNIPASSSLFNYNERNLAFLSSLQRDSRVPSVSISDLETKIITTGANGNGTGPAQALKAAFKITGHTRDGVDMEFLGSGVALIAPDKVEQTTQGSLQECFLRAAHRSLNVYFAYNPLKFICYVDQKITLAYGDQTKEDAKNRIGPFDSTSDAEPMSTIAIYKTAHHFGQYSDDFIDVTTLKDEHLLKFNAHMGLRDLAQDKPREFTINRFDVKLEIPPQFIEPKGSSGKGENKLIGYGLLADNANGVVLKPSRIEQKTGQPVETEITFDQCHLACMKDFKCKSFSVCIRNFATECVLSTVDLDLKQVSSQLATSDTNKSFSSNKRIKVKLNDEKKSEIELIKHATCELYRKNYLELFEFAGHSNLNYEAKTIAVAHLGECAERCVRQNLLLVGKNIEQFKRTEQLFKSSNLNALKEVYREHQEVGKEFCKGFEYFEKSQLPRFGQEFVAYFEKLVENLNDFKGSNKIVDGYCVMIESSNRNGTVKMPKEILTESYRFDPEFFYDKMPNYKLIASKMSRDEKQAFMNLAGASKRAVDETNLNTMKSFLDRGENIAHTESLPAKHCAARCFFQESTLWPACKSFDVIVEYGNNQNIVYCVYNTITLSEAQARNKSELIFHLDESKNDRVDVKIWHFDPRPGLALESSQLSELSQLEEVKFSHPLVGSSLALGAWMLILIGMVAGLLLGVKYGQDVVDRFSSANRRSSISQDLVPRNSI